MALFFEGLLAGFLMCVPVGPVALLLIHRTLKGGRIDGLISGFGAATADALYSLIAVLGLGAVSSLLIKEQLWLRLGGSIFLMIVGTKVFLSDPSEKTGSANRPAHISNLVSAFVLTLTNPLAFIAFTGVFAGLGLVNRNVDYASGGLLVAGVFVGAALWWFTLSNLVNIF